MSIFMVNKMSKEDFAVWFDNRVKEVAEERRIANKKEREKLKDVIGVSEYSYNLSVRKYIDARLAKIASINADFELNLDKYNSPSKKKAAEKLNREIDKKIGVLEAEIKAKDKFFYSFIKKA